MEEKHKKDRGGVCENSNRIVPRNIYLPCSYLPSVTPIITGKKIRDPVPKVYGVEALAGQISGAPWTDADFGGSAEKVDSICHQTVSLAVYRAVRFALARVGLFFRFFVDIQSPGLRLICLTAFCECVLHVDGFPFPRQLRGGWAYLAPRQDQFLLEICVISRANWSFQMGEESPY